MEENKNIYEKLRDARNVDVAMRQNMYGAKATIITRIQEHYNQPKDFQSKLELTIDGKNRTATIETDDERAEIPLGRLWEVLTNLAKGKTARCGTAKAVAITKQEMDSATERYCEQVIQKMTNHLNTLGGEWDLPCNDDTDKIPLGDPAVIVVPKTLFLDSNVRLHVVCLDADGYEYTSLVKYGFMGVNEIMKLSEMLERPIEEE